MSVQKSVGVIAAVNSRVAITNLVGPYNIVINGTWEGTITILRRFPDQKGVGTHSGSANASAFSGTLVGVTAADELIGMWVSNDTDGSFGPITDSTTTGITATLAGGTQNDWDVGDVASLWYVATTYTANNDPQATEYENGVDLVAVASAWSSGTARVRFSQ